MKAEVAPASARSKDFAAATYAGVLGKLIGVYLGRAVEGWRYEDIERTFGEISYYVNDRVNWPLIVPDDDISGTFLFFRALEDNGFPGNIDAKTIGETWLNYIVEDKTVLWWGGLGRSSEHTAYLRLKAGIDAPASGSITMNGRAMAEQIGAEIFVDTWALVNPGDPDRAVAMARSAGSVSHDGVAVEAACLLAAMEAQAFVERDTDMLLDLGISYVRDDHLRRVVGEVREKCAATNEWRAVRRWLGDNYGYDRYPGNCPMVPNHALLLAAFILGGDDFQRALMIAVSSGWDTDCNAGNVGCLNGIRLGLAGIEAGPDFRGSVSDRMYVVNADGGECLTDAVIETRRVQRASAALAERPAEPAVPRFAFEYPGSVQGFECCPLHKGRQAITELRNANRRGQGNYLEISYEGLATGVSGAVSVATFVDPRPRGVEGTSYFEVIASPTLYGTQTIRGVVRAFDDADPRLRFFIWHYDGYDRLVRIDGNETALARGDNALVWQVPDTHGLPIYRVGIELTADRRLDGRIALVEMDWTGAPENLVFGTSRELSPGLTPWDTTTTWIKSFVSSAKHFAPDIDHTFCLSHPDGNGIVTTGTRDWSDYEVSSTLILDLHKTVGLVARARGHRRYYAAIAEGDRAKIVKRVDRRFETLAETSFAFADHGRYRFGFSVRSDTLAFSIDGQTLIEARDDTYASGGAGFLIEEGTVPAIGFAVRSL